MLSNSLKRLNRTDRLIALEDISDDVLAGRSAAHTACWKYLQMASYDSALDYAQQIINREPEKPDGYIFKAKALFKMKRFQEAEQVLLQVMRIAEDNELIRTDVEGMIKLKDELANSRVEILRSRSFREPIDIAEMHWNDTKKPILELIGVARPPTDSRAREETTPMEIDPELIDIIGPERARQLYPQMFKSSANGSSYSRRRADNLDLKGDFPVRGRASDPKDSSDVELRTAGLKTALLLAEEKNQKYEKKIANLEQELKKVYEKTIKLNEEKRVMQKKCDTLVGQLDKVMNKGSGYRNVDEDDVQVIQMVQAKKPQQPPTNTAYDYIRKRKRRALVFTNSKYAANPRRYVDQLKAKAVNASRNQNQGGRDFPRPIQQLRQVSQQSRPEIFRPKVSAFKSVNFKADERLIRDLTFSKVRHPIMPTSVPQPSIMAKTSMGGGGDRRYPPGILPMPSYAVGGGRGQTTGYDYSNRFNRSAYF